MTATLVIGLGNRLRGDDAVGPVVVDALQPELRARQIDAELLVGRFDAMDLTNAWRNRAAVHVIDAFRSTEPPGSIRRIAIGPGADLGALRQAASTHALGLREAIGLAGTLQDLPGSLTVWGISAESFGTDQPLSPAVDQAVPELVRAVLAELSGNRAAPQQAD